MLTVGQMQRLWESNQQARLLGQLVRWRIEALAEPDLARRPCLTAAALGIIRLNELNQSPSSLSAKLIRAVIAHQEPDGGWGDPMITALCLRASALDSGRGPAIERGLAYLAALQQPAGIWPRLPLQRMPADASVTAFILLQLAGNPGFRAMFDFSSAIGWFEQHEHEIESDESARTFWRHARIVCPPAVFTGEKSISHR